MTTTETPPTPSPARPGIFSRLYHGETNLQVVPRARLWFILSILVILAGMASLVSQGLNLGIDFEGGTAWEVPAPDVDEAEARDALEEVGLGEAKIQILGGDTLRVQGRIEGEGDDADERQADRDEKQQAVTQRLAGLADTSVSQVSVNDVGPSWGNEISRKAQRALVFFLIAVTIYITLRFEWKMAIATLVALFHDILVTVGVYSLFGFEVTPATVIAFLTILGYSIYDGIVIFDKVEENTRGLASSGRMTYSDMVNLSLNQALMRSLNTSITALLPISSLLVVGAWILGATTLQEFALALLIGLASGAYSSIFIASPVLAILKERETRYSAIRQRLEARGGASAAAVLTPAAAAATGTLPLGDEDDVPRPSTGTTRTPSSPSTTAPSRPAGNRPPPRPRKKGRRR